MVKNQMVMLDQYGNVFTLDPEGISEMLFPVRCKWCHKIHDAGKVEVIQRYMDCSVWKCPNCGVKVDDRHIAAGGSAIPVNMEDGE